jgi:hypothetical protein
VDQGFKRARLFAGALVGAALLLAPAISKAATDKADQSYLGRWVDSDHKLTFDVRPAANDDQLVLVIPTGVNFPGSHEFRLHRAHGERFQANDPGRPSVFLWFKSASKAELKVKGHGATAGTTGAVSGYWMSINDYALIRP